MVSFVLLLISVQIGLVMSDLPIHCLHWQVKGKWHIDLSAFQTSANNCGYDHPDRNSKHFNNDNFNFVQSDSMKIELRSPDIVLENNEIIGRWTMVYDEGFELTLYDAHDDKPTMKLFSFMEYEPKGQSATSENLWDYTSHCDQTRVGWITKLTNTGPEYACTKCVQTHDEEGKSLIGSLPLTHNIHHKKKSSKRHLGFVSVTSYLKDDDIYQPNYSLVETINSDQTSLWKATVHKQFIGKTMKEMYALLGRNRYNSISLADKIGSQKVVVQPAPISFLDLNMSMTQPNSIDWRYKDGVNYMNNVRNQHSCGSCYAMASADAFSSRLNWKNKSPQQIVLSPQDVLSCSDQNQGCEGGYPYLVAKYGTEVGFLPEDCSRYTGHDQIQCSHEQCSDSERVKLKSYTYVGGYYGSCNEIRMIEELQNGPIVVAFDAVRDLFNYRSGIYHCGHHPTSEIQQGESSDEVHEWEKTTHAVVCIGYGQKMINGENVKYWIIKNSWGRDWGESGYFRVLRGGNTCGIESMAVSGTF